MRTGYCGTFVISWAQTEIDGITAAPVQALTVGGTWQWRGEALRVDGARDLLQLQGAEGDEALRRRAARAVRRLLGAAVGAGSLAPPDLAVDEAEQGFSVTDGYRLYTVTVIELPDCAARLLMFAGHIPPRETELWVVEQFLLPPAAAPQAQAEAPAVICFTPGTMIATPEGLRPVQDLQQGDKISTRDDGAQPILWAGDRRMSGARLHAMPHLRPVRFLAGALGIGRPDADLLVSPQHRMLLRGAAAQALFNETEVLVAAADLVNGDTVRVEHGLREAHYIHLLLERHQILRANGLECESFHPGAATLEMIAPQQRAGLLALLPHLAEGGASYGDYARRRLHSAEAAILRHDIAAA
jgi:hypothetical protein